MRLLKEDVPFDRICKIETIIKSINWFKIKLV